MPSDEMISLATGKSYCELPNAFAYRKAFNPNCSCNFRHAVNMNETVAGGEKPETVTNGLTTRFHNAMSG